MKRSIFKSLFFALLITCVCSFTIYAFSCHHDNQVNEVYISPTCTENGEEHIICVDCETVLAKNALQPTGHAFEKYILTVLPTPEANGIETGTCQRCGDKDEREYICPHESTYSEIAKEASCSEFGIENEVCGLCRSVLLSEQIEKLECSWGDWIEVKFATPFDDGVKQRTCINCDNIEKESFSMTMPATNSIYIPGTGICHKFAVTGFTQAGVDANDLSYSFATPFGFGSNDPFVLGHSTGTMRNLDKTKIGQYIYLSKDGIIETYRVVISEFAMQNAAWTNIVGQTSGASIWDNLGTKTLHMYTCYGETKNHRWMVLAELVE